MTNIPYVLLTSIEDDEGHPMVAVQFPDLGFSVSPSMVSFMDGCLTVAVPVSISLPIDAVVIERWLPPEQEQVMLAVEALSPVAIERLLIHEQMTEMGESVGVLAKRAVARAVLGETGVTDAD